MANFSVTTQSGLSTRHADALIDAHGSTWTLRRFLAQVDGHTKGVYGVMGQCNCRNTRDAAHPNGIAVQAWFTSHEAVIADGDIPPAAHEAVSVEVVTAVSSGPTSAKVIPSSLVA